MSNPTRIAARTTRCVDFFDVAVAEAMLLHALGPDSGALTVGRDVPGTLTLELSAHGQQALTAMALSQDEDDLAGWMELLTIALVDEAVAAAGADWRAEAELGVELLAAGRADDMPALARAAADGVVRVDPTRTLRAILHDSACDPSLVRFL